MKKTIGTAVAGAMLCALALAGCGGKTATSGSGNGAAGSVATPAAAVTGAQGNPGAGVPSATPTGAAAVDSELNTINQQLGVAGSDLAQATQRPSDGD